MVKELRDLKQVLPPAAQVFLMSDLYEYPQPAPATKVLDRVRAICSRPLMDA